MKKVARIVAGVGLAVACAGHVAPVHAQQRATHGLIVTIRMDNTARVLDQTPSVSVPPPGWNTPRFDDSAWDSAQRVPVSVGTCAQGSVNVTYKGMYTGPMYWGANQLDHYLFRQTFHLPKAHDYYGSEVGVVGGFLASTFSLYVNGTLLNTGTGYAQTYYSGTRYNIEKYLRVGANVVAVNTYPTSTANCSGLQFRVIVHATSVK